MSVSALSPSSGPYAAQGVSETGQRRRRQSEQGEANPQDGQPRHGKAEPDQQETDATRSESVGKTFNVRA
jgi:hypothetical protein